MRKEDVEKLVDKFKRIIKIEFDKQNYNGCLGLISVCANILYQTNLYYSDNMLEFMLNQISKKMHLNQYTENDRNKFDNNCLIFYDAFGLNDRGLAQIYLKALCQCRNVVYVTYEDRKNQIPDVLDIVYSYGCRDEYIKRAGVSCLNQLLQFNDIIKKNTPKQMFFYAVPNDVVATPVLYAYDGFIQRFQINLTDHAFWLGSGCIDKCIEFRDYGACISKEYRGIDEDKIVKVPFYPVIHYERAFKGFPFNIKENQKVFFSGGALYKTFGDNNRYYKIVDNILQKYPNTIFWYAGSGDESELRKLMPKYPERIYLTEERSDLFQVLENCCFYLSTYPICGGLMFQYAAMAGKVPVTLKCEEIFDTEGYLLNQQQINIMFSDSQKLYDEIDRLLGDEDYCSLRAYEMKKAVISPAVFDNVLRKIISNENEDTFEIKFEYVDTTKFQQLYLERINSIELDKMVAKKEYIMVGMKYYPFRYLRGVLYKIKDRVGNNKCK